MHRAPADAAREWARYLRVSDERGREGDNFHSPDQQDTEICRRISELGGRVGPRYYDASVSGGSMDRPEFQRVWAWVMERPRERGIMTYDFSRFGRTEDVATWFGRLRAAGSELLTVKDDVSNTLIRSVLVGVNAYYREQTGDRYASIIERRFERGEHHGTPPVGYRRQAGSGPLIVDPVIGPAITEVFERYARGDSVHSIAKFLASATGNRVSTPAVRRAIALQTYRGVVTLNGRTRPGRHPALVTDETWERCQGRRRLSRATPARTLQRAHVLAGMVICGHCFRNLVIRCVKGDRVLVCPGFYRRDPKTGERDCATGIGAPKVERVVDAVIHVLGEWTVPDDSESSRSVDLVAAVERQKTLLWAAESRLAGVREAVDRLSADYYSGAVASDKYDRTLAVLEQRERNEQFAVDTCRKELSDAASAAATVRDSSQRRIFQSVVDTWPDADAEHRRRIIESWLSHVTVERKPAGSPLPLHEYVMPWPRAFWRSTDPMDVVGPNSWSRLFADEVRARRIAK